MDLLVTKGNKVITVPSAFVVYMMVRGWDLIPNLKK